MFTEDSRCMQTHPSGSGGGSSSRRRTFATQAAFDATYRINDVVHFIVANSYQRVGLQFPDVQLHDTVRLVHRIKDRIAEQPGGVAPSLRLFVLADNTFGACCPDEITAQHYNADAIVHFGSACMSRSVRLPCLYVHDFIAPEAATQVVEVVSRRIAAFLQCLPPATATAEVVVFMPTNVHCAIGAPVAEALGALSLPVVFASPRDAKATDLNEDSEISEWEINGMRFARSQSSTVQQAIVYVGSTQVDGEPLLAQLALIAEHNSNLRLAAAVADDETPGMPFLSAISINAEHLTNDEIAEAAAATAVNKAVKLAQGRLRQRMFNVETLKAASSVGIIVASLAIHKFREVAEAVRAALIQHGKRAYIIYVGHPNEFKIANFADSMDAFCIIACPNSRLAHFPTKADNLMKPFVEPFEVFLALGLCDFMCPEAFTTMFAPVVRIAKLAASRGGSSSSAENTASAALVKARPMNVAIQGGGGGALQRLNEREYVGLEMRVGETPVQAELADGKSGIARGYTAEREAQPH